MKINEGVSLVGNACYCIIQINIGDDNDVIAKSKGNQEDKGGYTVRRRRIKKTLGKGNIRDASIYNSNQVRG